MVLNLMGTEAVSLEACLGVLYPSRSSYVVLEGHLSSRVLGSGSRLKVPPA